MISSLWLYQTVFVFFHLHCERESCAAVFPFRKNFYRAAILNYQVLTNHQSHSDSFMIHFSCPQKLAKELEQAIDVFRKYTSSSVNDVHFEQLFNFVESHDHADLTASTELEGVLDQVDQNLLESDLVSD